MNLHGISFMFVKLVKEEKYVVLVLKITKSRLSGET